MKQPGFRKSLAIFLVVAIAGAAVLAGLFVAGSDNRPGKPQASPAKVAVAFFSSINKHNRQLIESEFVPADRYIVANVSDWNLYQFSVVHCHATRQTRISATVVCDFKLRSPVPPEMTNVSSWNIDLQDSASSSWMITDYGQG